MRQHIAFSISVIVRSYYVIIVKIENNCISASGHAGYAPKGYDIVCAAFSALSFTLERAVKELTDDIVSISIQNGLMRAHWRILSPKGRLLMDAYIGGIKALAECYPEYIKVQVRNT